MQPANKSTALRDDGLVREQPSKTQLKQQMLALQQLGQQLTELPAERLRALELPERLRDAIEEFKRTRSHEGRRRQLQFIGKLMRTVDPEPLRAALDAHALGPARESLRLHEAERWRLELVSDERAAARWAQAFPHSDLARLRTLIGAAQREQQVGDGQRHGRAWRTLFQFIKPHLGSEGPIHE
jgi:ribosome-associated protein